MREELGLALVLHKGGPSLWYASRKRRLHTESWYGVCCCWAEDDSGQDSLERRYHILWLQRRLGLFTR